MSWRNSASMEDALARSMAGSVGAPWAGCPAAAELETVPAGSAAQSPAAPESASAGIRRCRVIGLRRCGEAISDLVLVVRLQYTSIDPIVPSVAGRVEPARHPGRLV